MKTLIRITLAVAIAATTAFAADFEGKVEMKAKAPDMAMLGVDSMSMNMAIKGAKVRMDMKAAGAGAQEGLAAMMNMSVIINTDKKEAAMLNSAKKTALVMPIKDKTEEAGSSKFDGDFKATGKTDTILGYKVEEYVSTSESGSYTEMWLSKDLGAFRAMQQQGQKQKGWEKFLADNNFFPMKLVEYSSKGGKVVSEMEVTKVEKGSVPDSTFEIPADYKKMDLGDMLKGLGQ